MENIKIVSSMYKNLYSIGFDIVFKIDGVAGLICGKVVSIEYNFPEIGMKLIEVQIEQIINSIAIPGQSNTIGRELIEDQKRIECSQKTKHNAPFYASDWRRKHKRK